MEIAEVFQSGNLQAIRFPKTFHLDADKASIDRVGRALLHEVTEHSTHNFSSFNRLIDGLNCTLFT
jgi:virulence-associated protein VagC